MSELPHGTMRDGTHDLHDRHLLLIGNCINAAEVRTISMERERPELELGGSAPFRVLRCFTFICKYRIKEHSKKLETLRWFIDVCVRGNSHYRDTEL